MSFPSVLCAALIAVLALGRAHAQSSESPQEIEARAIVERAKTLVTIKNYGAALAEYMRALELLEGHPRRSAVLHNIAVCYEQMFRYDLALQYYEAYLREADAADPGRGEVERLVASLRALLGTVRITGVRAGEIWIDNRKLGDAPIDVMLPAGFHAIEIRARGYEAERRELRVTAGQVHELHVELQPIEPPGLSPAYFWVGFGLTAAAVATGSALGLAALSEDAAGDRKADADYRVDGQDAKDLALQADIAFGAAVAFGVGTVVLSFLTDWGGPRESERSSTTALGFGVTNDAVVLSLQGITP